MKLELRIDAPDDGDPQSTTSDFSVSPVFQGTADLSKVLEQELFALAPEMADYGTVEISVSLLSPEEIRDVNRDYRQCDEATDVLSFPMWEVDGHFAPDPMLADSDLPLPLGDVMICPQEVKRLHPELPEMDALCLMLAHSFLHLLAWDHDTDERQEAMWARQDIIRDKLMAALQSQNAKHIQEEL